MVILRRILPGNLGRYLTDVFFLPTIASCWIFLQRAYFFRLSFNPLSPLLSLLAFIHTGQEVYSPVRFVILVLWFKDIYQRSMPLCGLVQNISSGCLYISRTSFYIRHWSKCCVEYIGYLFRIWSFWSLR